MFFRDAGKQTRSTCYLEQRPPGPAPEVTAIRRTSTTSTDLAPTPRAILVALA